MRVGLVTVEVQLSMSARHPKTYDARLCWCIDGIAEVPAAAVTRAGTVTKPPSAGSLFAGACDDLTGELANAAGLVGIEWIMTESREKRSGYGEHAGLTA